MSDKIQDLVKSKTKLSEEDKDKNKKINASIQREKTKIKLRYNTLIKKAEELKQLDIVLYNKFLKTVK